jgi:hypothetical protein
MSHRPLLLEKQEPFDAFAPLEIAQDVHFIKDQQTLSFDLSEKKTRLVCECQNIQLRIHLLGSAELSLHLQPDSSVSLLIDNSTPSFSFSLQATQKERSHLKVHQAFQLKSSKLFFQNYLYPNTTCEHTQRAFLDSGSLVSSNELIILDESIDAEVNQNIQIIKKDRASQIEIKPWLWVGYHQVKAKHGTGIGSFPAETLRYLQSKGLTKEEAQNSLKEAFLYEHF